MDIIGPNDGVLFDGATFAPGKVDQAFSFDGENDRVGAPGTNIDNLQQLTIEAWVKHNSLPSNKIQRYVTLQGEKAVLRYDNYSQKLQFYMEIDDELRHIWSNEDLQAGFFHHVVGTYDGNFMQLYLDGALVGSRAVSGTVKTGHRVNLSSYQESLDGLLDEVAIYDRALSASDIQSIFNAGNDGKCRAQVQCS